MYPKIFSRRGLDEVEKWSNKRKIAIIGPYPPPYGGISVYIKRFRFFLNDKGINNILYNSGEFVDKEKNIIHLGLKKILLRLIFDKSNIIHSNEIGIKTRSIIPFFRLLGKKVILTIHGDSFKIQIKELGGIKKRIFIHQLKLYNNIIVVNPNIKKKLLDEGIDSLKISVIPAFIPPAPDETDIKQLPEIFHQIRKKHKFLITANAFKISFYNNQDLYGIDLSIELMKRLVNRGYKRLGFIYVIPDIGDYNYYESMKIQVEENDLQEHFHFYTKPVAYPAVINMCDLFIRPTNMDGYGVSLAEAIILKRAAIASDVCKRPEGTILFKSRDIDDLYIKTTDVINSYEEYRERIENIEFGNNVEKILEVYKKVLNGK